MTKQFTATVPVKFTKDGKEQVTFRRVGAMFENTRTETGEIFFSLKLDFPVAVTELVMFPKNSNGPEE